MSSYSRRHFIVGFLAAVPAGGLPSAYGTPLWKSSGQNRPDTVSEDAGNQAAGEGKMVERISLTSIEGVLVGHARRDYRPTGCTVVLTTAGAVAGVDVRGDAEVASRGEVHGVPIGHHGGPRSSPYRGNVEFEARNCSAQRYPSSSSGIGPYRIAVAT